MGTSQETRRSRAKKLGDRRTLFVPWDLCGGKDGGASTRVEVRFSLLSTFARRKTKGGRQSHYLCLTALYNVSSDGHDGLLRY
jgi:hypothetical protein